jgi:negative regulator of flagellin synthesis FlgM
VKIRNDDGISRGMAPTPQQVQGGRLDASAQALPSGKHGADRLELSDRGRALQVAAEALKKTPEVRADRVESLKQQLKDGSYHVSGENIADRLLGDGLFA